MKANATREYRGIRISKRYSRFDRGYAFFINGADYPVKLADVQEKITRMRGLSVTPDCGYIECQTACDTLTEAKRRIDAVLAICEDQ